MRRALLFLLLVVGCQNEWAGIDAPIDPNDQDSIDSHLFECALAKVRGDPRHERCAEVALYASHYLDLGGSCASATRARRFADPTDPRWVAVEAKITSRCGAP